MRYLTSIQGNPKAAMINLTAIRCLAIREFMINASPDKPSLFSEEDALMIDTFISIFMGNKVPTMPAVQCHSGM